MTNPFDIPPNHRLLAAESALAILYGATGLIGVTAEIRDEAVNQYLVSQGKARVSRDTIRRAMRRLRERHGGREKVHLPVAARASAQMLDDWAARG